MQGQSSPSSPCPSHPSPCPAHPSPPLRHSACGSIPPSYVFCWGTCRACLANEKLLWIPLWAFQEGLARFLQSRHSKTVCFSKYIRDFSGAWLWQGLSAVVSQVVSLLGCTNRKVLSGIDTGLLGLCLSGRLHKTVSESCYLLTALPRLTWNNGGCGEASLPKMLTVAPAVQPWQGGQRSPNNPLRPTEPPSHPPLCPQSKTQQGPPTANAQGAQTPA